MARLETRALAGLGDDLRMLGLPLITGLVEHVVAVEALVGSLRPYVTAVGHADAAEWHLLVLVDVGLEVRGPLVAVHAVAGLARHAQVRGVRNLRRARHLGAPVVLMALEAGLASRRRELEELRHLVSAEEARVVVGDERRAVGDRLRLMTLATTDTLVSRVLEVHVAALEQVVAREELRRWRWRPAAPR